MTRCEYTELWCGDAASVAGGGAPVGEGVGKVRYQRGDFGGVGSFDWARFLPQDRVAELEDGSNRHSRLGG